MVIGSYAMLLNKVSKLPADFDIWVDSSSYYREQLSLILNHCITKDEDFFIKINDLLSITILSKAEGLVFEEAYNNSNERITDGISYRYLCLNDLLVNKKATGRKKDFFDIELINQLLCR